MPIISPFRLRFSGSFGGAAAIPTAFRYYRLYVTKYSHDNNIGAFVGDDVRVAELELFADAVAWPTENMTGASAPAPFVASASSDDGSRPAWQAFQGGLSDGERWISSQAGGAQWLKIDLGEAVELTSYKIAPDGAASGGYFIVSWELQGSETGDFAGEEVTVDTQTDITTGWSNNTLRTFTLA